MNRREFLGKMGISASLLAVLPETFLAAKARPSPEVALRLDQEDQASSVKSIEIQVVKSIEIQVEDSFYEIPIYTLE